MNGEVQGLEVLPGGGGRQLQCLPLSSSTPAPALAFSSLSPKIEAVAPAMSSCSCVPCMFPTLHPSSWRGSHYNKF